MIIKTVKDSYLNWIKENTSFTDVINNNIEISTPFVDSLNENIKIYVIPGAHNFKISDDGYTLWNLESMGLSFRKGSSRERILLNTIERFNVTFDYSTNEIFMHTNQQEMGKTIHTFLQTILSISDMLIFNKNTVKNLFFDEVNAYFDKHNDIYDKFPDFEIQGKSKLSYRFDYLMNVKNKQKKLVKLINNIDQVQVERTLVSWQDTSVQRMNKYNENLGMVALINDSKKGISTKYREALDQYGIESIGFSNKDDVKRSLSLVG